PMPLYFFHLVPSPDGPLEAPDGPLDDIGIELADVEQAYLQAYEAALDISFEMLRGRQDPSDLRFEVTNERGEILIELPFREALEPKRRVTSLSPLYASLHQNFERQQELNAELKTQFRQTVSSILAARQLIARALPGSGR